MWYVCRIQCVPLLPGQSRFYGFFEDLCHSASQKSVPEVKYNRLFKVMKTRLLLQRVRKLWLSHIVRKTFIGQGQPSIGKE